MSGKTEVSGATVNGQAVTIDKSGVHAGGHDAPVFDPINNGQVQQALQQAEAAYRQTAYETLLKRIGTSFAEIRAARLADEPTPAGPTPRELHSGKRKPLPVLTETVGLVEPD